MVEFFTAFGSIATVVIAFITAFIALQEYKRGRNQHKLENSLKLIDYYWAYMNLKIENGDSIYTYLDAVKWGRIKTEVTNLLNTNPIDNGAFRQNCELLNLISKQCLENAANWEFIVIEFKDILEFSIKKLNEYKKAGINPETLFESLFQFYNKHVINYQHLGKRNFKIERGGFD